MNPGSKSQLDVFWGDFQAVLIEHGVSRERVRWYLRWAELFARSLSSRLEDRSATEIDGFLSHLKSQPNVKDWQVAQAADSLRIMYQVFFDVDWAHLKSWPIQNASGAVPFFRKRVTPETELPDTQNLMQVDTTFAYLLEEASRDRPDGSLST